MAGINPNLPVTTLNVNGLHTSKIEICRTEFKKLYNYIFSKRDILYIQKYKLIVRMEKYILCFLAHNSLKGKTVRKTLLKCQIL